MEHLFANPGYKLSTLKSIPQVASGSKAFTAHSWSYLTKHLRQMHIAGSFMEEGVNWHVRLPGEGHPPPQPTPRRGAQARSAAGHPSPGSAHGGTAGAAVDAEPVPLRAASSLLLLRGLEAPTVDVTPFCHSGLHAGLALDPLLAASHEAALGGNERTAVLWSTSQSIVRPLDALIGKAFAMFNSGAYLHHYHKYGIENEDFLDTFANLEQTVMNYRNM